MLFLFTRVGPIDQNGASNTSSSILEASSRDLRKAKSTPILRINGIPPTVTGIPPTHPPATDSPELAADASGVPSALSHTTSNTSTAARLACPKPPYIPDQAYNRHSSFTRKIRYRLSSLNRGSGSPVIQPVSSLTRADELKGLDSKAFRLLPINASGTMSPTSEEYTSDVYNQAKALSAFSTRDRSQSVFDSKTPYTNSMAFFKGGLNKAHKFIGRALEGFPDKESEEEVSDESHDEDEDDLNMLYTVMVPLEFPDEEDGENTSSSSSSPFEPDFDKDRSKNHSDGIPGYCFKKQSSSCLSTNNQPLAPQNEPLTNGIDSTLLSQFTSNPKPPSVPSQQSDLNQSPL
ncbi:hypothetical protein PGT21_026549 [Puccinia graminis f. sp. tritici]|uniref:Uncharacterized protein n=2 Tax=Puccinia graminis f. sp. tritici TaxID=56615 RepID=E3L1Y2_PUCGT|nr:uncharacterized protein PGTG_16583 [Puccinia graminis f. sp. tritici CRL 75-36-700-3]EFP90557.1 hypothetical protein PGTG_16583 [Puccinia graminis f. sp. tritici CRL 75-36-700-3]KAA1089666.1 hypothetical protein PGT21_026549 [Puccinia graminis f. sp. tritici]